MQNLCVQERFWIDLSYVKSKLITFIQVITNINVIFSQLDPYEYVRFSMDSYRGFFPVSNGSKLSEKK